MILEGNVKGGITYELETIEVETMQVCAPPKRIYSACVFVCVSRGPKL